jgi:D-xylose transport system substrate-binding protein
MRIKNTARYVAPLLLASGVLSGAFGVGTSGASVKANATPVVTVSSFTRNFSAMATLKPLVSKGKGKIPVILPDTVTSARYTEFDAPYLKTSLTTAGFTASQFIIQNAQGSDGTQYTDAQSDISNGASYSSSTRSTLEPGRRSSPMRSPTASRSLTMTGSPSGGAASTT